MPVPVAMMMAMAVMVMTVVMAAPAVGVVMRMAAMGMMMCCHVQKHIYCPRRNKAFFRLFCYKVYRIYRLEDFA